MRRYPRDSWILDSSTRIPELIFLIPIASGIPDSLSYIPHFKPRIPDSKSTIFLDSGFYKQNFPGFWIPESGMRIPDSFAWGKAMLKYLRESVNTDK